MGDAARVHKLLRQQSAIARFGTFALGQTDLLTVLNEAARVCAEGLSVPFCKICRYRAAEDDLLIVAGHGWEDGVIGCVVSPANGSSPQGRAFTSGEPVICEDIRADAQFQPPPFYADHQIISTIDVIIRSKERPYGVLEIDNNQQHRYDQHDIDFLTGFANVLGEAVSTSERTALLEVTVDRMRELVEEKDRLLDQKKVLAEELQHRVRNNLQLVSGMLSRQLETTTDAAGHRGLKSIARRVSTLAQVYDQLLGTEMTRTIDFGEYLKSLCLNLAEFQDVPGVAVSLSCESDTIMLDLDVVTSLGIVVAELVTNSYEHAFPGGVGTITVSARRDRAQSGKATLTIADDGIGFTAQAESKRHGLGLVRRLVEETRGEVSVKAAAGTVWRVRFPMANAWQADGA
ncbi:MAG: histidine kinase [Sphingomonadales bacterium 32-68-7]|nr:MAG: histidine kinase [Sphingomonadales bacterium 12-68-11]OYX10241.1 MAG: histidine kinase [Sphingomonadales bacterium 32-68-7]